MDDPGPRDRRLASLEAILEHSTDAIIAAGADGRISEWNRGAERLFGYTAREAIGRPFSMMMEPLDREAQMERWRQVLAGERVPTYDGRRIRKDGSPVDVSVSFSPICDPAGSIVGVAGILSDITGRAAAERDRAEAIRAMHEAQRLAKIGSWWWEPSTGRASWSDELYRIFERDPALGPAVGDALLEYVHEDDRGRVRAAAEHLSRPGSGGPLAATVRAEPLDCRITTGRGAERSIETRVIARAGPPPRLVGSVQDVTELQAAQRARATAQGRFVSAFNHSPTGMALATTDGRLTDVNQALCAITGYTADELCTMTISDLTHPDDREADHGLVAALLDGTVDHYERDKRYVRKTGGTIWIALHATVIRDDHGRPRQFLGQMADVTERKRAADALAAAEQRFRTATEYAPTGIAIVGLDPAAPGRVISANPTLSELTGYRPEALMELGLPSIVHPDEAERLTRDLRLLGTDEQARVELELRLMRRDGRIAWALLNAAAVPGGDGPTARQAVVHILDIETRKRFEGQLQYLADHDALSGLFNRRRFEEELARAVAQAGRHGRPGAVLLIDLDGFKNVNDTMGHSYGDELITRIGAILRNALRGTDVLARLGGDEFAVALDDVDAATALGVAEKLVALLADRAIAVGAHRRARVTASIGVTTFEGRSDRTTQELLVEADVAMYEAKEAGKNGAALYRREGSDAVRLPTRASWLARLRTAIDDGAFELHAQPIRALGAPGPDTYELLIRLRGAHGELVPPGTFLYIAEQFELIQEIDRWVFRQATELLRDHDRAGLDVCLTMNMSGRTVNDPGLLRTLAAHLIAHPIPPDRLIVEVTETAAITNIEKATRVAAGLRRLGCRFALDDFGAGFASFYYLKHLEFDYLKIDGEFIKGIDENRTDQMVVRSVVDIARGLGAETIAEFVSDDRILARLRELGVDYAQGYHLGRPEPIEEILPALRGR